MHVHRSLVPYAIGRYASRRTGSLSHSTNRPKSSTSLSNSGDQLDEHVYEGELVGKSQSYSSAASGSSYRCYTQHAYQSQEGDTPFLSATDAIRTYLNNAGYTGINHSAFENTLDIYV